MWFSFCPTDSAPASAPAPAPSSTTAICMERIYLWLYEKDSSVQDYYKNKCYNEKKLYTKDDKTNFQDMVNLKSLFL